MAWAGLICFFFWVDWRVSRVWARFPSILGVYSLLYVFFSCLYSMIGLFIFNDTGLYLVSRTYGPLGQSVTVDVGRLCIRAMEKASAVNIVSPREHYSEAMVPYRPHDVFRYPLRWTELAS